MSDVNVLTYEMLGGSHASVAAHQSRPEFKCVTSRVHAIVLILLVAISTGLGGCDSSSSSGLPPDGPPDDSPGGPIQVCQGPQPTPTAAKGCGCDADCDLG
jgi:hypothetical protein